MSPPLRHFSFFSSSSPSLFCNLLFLNVSSLFLFVPFCITYVLLLSLLSSGHDCSLRLWNLDSKTCVQEITAHRKKSEEAIYDVAFHPSKAYIASAGADALARVYV